MCSTGNLTLVWKVLTAHLPLSGTNHPGTSTPHGPADSQCLVSSLFHPHVHTAWQREPVITCEHVPRCDRQPRSQLCQLQCPCSDPREPPGQQAGPGPWAVKKAPAALWQRQVEGQQEERGWQKSQRRPKISIIMRHQRRAQRAWYWTQIQELTAAIQAYLATPWHTFI